MTSEPSWVSPLREVASGKPRPPSARDGAAIELVRGAPPGWLAGDAVHAITSVFLAALLIAAAWLRSHVQAGPVDLIGLLLRTASVAFALRALIALSLWLRRLARDSHASAHVLVWSRDGILWRAPDGERWLAREDVAAVVVPEERVVRGAATSLTPLYVVARPQSELTFWALPPYFSLSSEVLAARLERFRKPEHEPEPPVLPVPLLAPDERYSRAARGVRVAGEVPVREGFGYRLRAPYGVLLALVFVADAVLSAGALRARMLPAALLAALLAPGALLVWFVWMRRRRAVRLGIALLLTPEELLVRGKQGVVSVPWAQLASAEVVARLAWSPLVGSYLVRTLWFLTQDGMQMPFDGGFLAAPAEVVAALANAYRTGVLSTGLPASGSSHGSGVGGGISGTLATTTTADTTTSP
jgi:hypothetical protein